ncbi:DNA glycosylase AlkZ-like family protein [Nannocystaceae bacterium ST9]
MAKQPSPANVRSWWWTRQGLDGSLTGSDAAAVLEHSGWARSVGGVGPYLTLFARAGLGRAAIDRALAEQAIHELPSARGCTYVVPASDFALALTLAREHADKPIAQAAKLGVTGKEIDRLCVAIVDALAEGPLDPEGIRERIGEAARSLGPEGIKKGMTTTLPLGLGRLQAQGEIRRIPIDGRLDQQRYRYARWTPNPLAGSTLTRDEAFIELARRYFRWIGPATLAEFQWFSALGVKASKAAIAPLGLVAPFEGDERLMFAEDREALLAHRPSKAAAFQLVASIDAIVLLRRDHASLLEPGDVAVEVIEDRSDASLGGLADLPSHAILDRGRLIGLWEYDTDAQAIVWASFVGRPKALVAAVAGTEGWIRDELGDARSFSLDSPKSRAPRIAGLRRLAG